MKKKGTVRSGQSEDWPAMCMRDTVWLALPDAGCMYQEVSLTNPDWTLSGLVKVRIRRKKPQTYMKRMLKVGKHIHIGKKKWHYSIDQSTAADAS